MPVDAPDGFKSKNKKPFYHNMTTIEKYDDGRRCQSGVIESHYGTADWQLVLLTYKKWLADKGKTFSYLFVLLGGELVHHEINPSELI
ncbi:hypothetical protein S576_23655 [Salmonella enterica subsp. enterica serovar Give]|nr:hypothetical protein [Salmonella enterica subsp. enterica serovar Give]EED4548150.1 hypothetical protein [Salmonella enterica subsp. enterica serovar Give]